MKPTTASPAASPASSSGSTDSLLRHLWSAVVATAILTLICCGAYPLLVWGVGQILFPAQANGSLVTRDGAATTRVEDACGSALLSQGAAAPGYFHPRPSAAGAGHDAASSSGSNLGPLSDRLLNGVVQKDDRGQESLAYDGIRLRTLLYALENGISFQSSIPLERFRDRDGKLDEVEVVKAFPHAGDPADKKPLVLSALSRPIPGDAVTASASGLDPHISLANAAIQKARVAKKRGINEDVVQQLIDEHTDRPWLGILGEPGVRVLTLNLALDKAHPLAR